ncbi:hypothetical protein DET51_102425 [Marinobacter nauticus]|uniref:Uncharacterized protein n=1 Tax=Marinobacter nauticus TaxID=2743 RepID=A0A368V843_MARNT|nr:hypothetical protein DET51_102425 [Marinobacter nauticus]
MLQKQQNPHKAGFVRILNGARRWNRTTETLSNPLRQWYSEFVVFEIVALCTSFLYTL